MATIITRAGKGSPLTNAELDGNFNNINAELATAVITGGTINGATIGATTATTGKFSQLDVDNLRLDANTISSTNVNGNVTITPNGTGEVTISKLNVTGVATLATGAVLGTPASGIATNLTGTAAGLTAGGNVPRTSTTGAAIVPGGTTAQRDAVPVVGYLRYNSTTSEFEGYGGVTPAWASVGGSAISNDTTTATNLYPAFLAATTGTAASIYTSNAKLLYKPSTGELQSSGITALNGLVFNASTLVASTTVATGFNASSVGPFTVPGGMTVTVSSGSRWVVL